MRIDILTIFPRMFDGPFSESILARAASKGLLEINIIDLRHYALDKHRSVDDYPFGGGPGMVMKPAPFFLAMEELQQRHQGTPMRVILLCPGGKVFNQEKARELSQQSHLVFLCGHYEGIDDRVRQRFVTDEISIGDYVLTGGELASMVVIDAVVRLLPGVLGDACSVVEESFSEGLLEYPQFTRPREYQGLSVPDVLLSGNHEEIRKWRRRESLRRTLINRPDLLASAKLTDQDRQMMAEIAREI
ncbi:MAG: tRNA (guanosine(37)-N1)-methyltransferase TrmD [Bacillota bacterium]